MTINIRTMQQSAANPVSGVTAYSLGNDTSAAAITLSVDSTQTNCDVLDIRGIRTLAIKPSASVTSLTFYGCDTNNGTFVLINDLGTAGALTVTASVWNIVTRTAFEPHHFIQMKSNQASATAIVVAKS